MAKIDHFEYYLQGQLTVDAELRAARDRSIGVCLSPWSMNACLRIGRKGQLPQPSETMTTQIVLEPRFPKPRSLKSSKRSLPAPVVQTSVLSFTLTCNGNSGSLLFSTRQNFAAPPRRILPHLCWLQVFFAKFT